MSEQQVATVGRHRRLADSDDSDDDDAQKNTILTTAKASDLCPKDYRLIARGQHFTSLEDMSSLRSLDYVDLTKNALRSVEGLGSNKRLKTLILRDNKLSNIDPILRLAGIRVLNIAENEFATLEWLPRAKFASELLVLVAAANKLASLDGISSLVSLKTLVISNNNIEDLKPVTRLSSLTKLSASNNVVRRIPDEISNLHDLSELRLAHNRLSQLPSREILVRLGSMKILDVGHNRLTSFDHLSSLQSSLTNLSVKKNPASAADDCQETLTVLCPKLEVIDGQRIAGGRRKLRVNRQRREVGFPLEPERKFARPPPKSVLTDQERKRPRSETGNDEWGEMEGEPETEWREEQPAEVPKLKKKKVEPIDDGPALDASEFMQKARKNSLSLPSRMQGGVKVKASREQGSSKKKKKHRSKAADEGQVFGSEGVSKW